MITPEQVKKFFDYSPDTGILIWKSKPSRRGRVKVGSVAGGINHYGYINITVMRRQYAAHRIAWAWYYGKWPEGQIDHINHNRSDNRISNLRDVSPTFNQKHVKRYKNSKNKKPGVIFDNERQCWAVTIGCKRILRTKDYLDAVAARVKAENEHGYHDPSHETNY